jgi:hypothetical protein
LLAAPAARSLAIAVKVVGPLWAAGT